MRTNTTLYYILKDHLGSASVVTTDTGAPITNGEQRYYPYGESRMTATMLTDKLFTGQRDTGLGIYNYGARFYDPKLGRFLSADTIVPGVGNPQAYNRYAYTLNNPLRYIDPSGHFTCSNDKTKDDYCPGHSTSGGTGGAGNTPPPVICSSSMCNPNGGGGGVPLVPSPSGAGGGNGGGDIPGPIDYGGPCIGEPTAAGNFYGGYCGGGGDLATSDLNSIGLDGNCEFGGCSSIYSSGGSIPLRYNASYDALVYENMLVIILDERYWFPAVDFPKMDEKAKGGSMLFSKLTNGQQELTKLGGFIPTNYIGDPTNMTTRDIRITYFGKDNFPTQLVIKIIFGSPSYGGSVINYPLQYTAP